MMITDYHCHILPDFDDGSDSVETSLRMIEKMKSQGVGRIIATPHFYAHREESVDSYLERRKKAFDILKESNPAVENIMLGVEVAIENGISSLDGLEKLAFQNTEYILLELPFTNYSKWIAEEIYNVSCRYKLKIILAHIHRYRNLYSKSQLAEILEVGAVLQVNNEAFRTFGSRHFVKKLIKDGHEIVFGSDSHNMTSRPPNWDVLKKYVKGDIIEKSNSLI
ncbi:MAG: capsular polysaccharide biosynthesis protein [Ruminococcus flavefaciens]|nr:capsular polysaccharide biosynthesis protein [Ruminococcus flavefaciens]